MSKIEDLVFVSEDRCKEIQEELATKIQMKQVALDSIQYVAGVDLAYWSETTETGKTVEKAVCCIVVIDKDTKQVVDKKHIVGEVAFPYIAGFLSFRELPLILKCVATLEIKPDLYVIDGNGYFHDKHMGIATHASFYLGKPTIGVSKNFYKFHEDMEDNTKVVGENVGDTLDIIHKGEVYGRILRTMKKAKPVYVSVGNYIDLDSATKIVSYFANKLSRIPTPTQQADLMTHEMREKYRRV